MRIFYYLFTFPLQIIAEFIIAIKINNISEMLESCIEVVDRKHNEIPIGFVKYLKAAEDHRNDHHLGVDHVAICRAIFCMVVKKKVQGASTIEQQFVRVVTNKYQKTFSRKIFEQIIAVLLIRRRCKINIARAYLSVAYYGSGYVGTLGIANIIGKPIGEIAEQDIISIVSRLKYPEPFEKSSDWQILHHRRMLYVKSRS